MKVHLFDYEHSAQFPRGDKDSRKATKCGYIRDRVTQNIKEVTCKLCFKKIEFENREELK